MDKPDFKEEAKRACKRHTELSSFPDADCTCEEATQLASDMWVAGFKEGHRQAHRDSIDY